MTQTTLQAEAAMPLSHFDPTLNDSVDGAQDIGPAIVAAVRHAQEHGAATLVIPPGEWEMRSVIDIDLDFDAQGNEVSCHFKIVGAGMNLSKIIMRPWMYPAKDRIRLDTSKRNSTLEISDLAFLAIGQGMQEDTFLLRSRAVRRGGQMQRTAVIRNVLVMGYDDYHGGGSREYFRNLFDLSCHNRPLIENLVTDAGTNENVYTGSDWSDDSDLWTVDRALVLDGAYAPEVDQCIFSRARYGIICRGNIPETETSPIDFTYAADDEGGQPEVGVFTNNRFPTCILGLVWHRDGQEPGLSVRGNFFDFRDYGAYVKGARMGEILNNTFVQKVVDEAEYPTRTNPKDILLNDVDGLLIEHNFFQGGNPVQGTPDPMRIAIDIHCDDPATEQTQDVIVGTNYVAQAAVLERYCRKMANTGALYYKDPVVAGSATVGQPMLLEAAATIKHTPYA
ncbi:hypothetical protein [Mangrovicoccus algicola]|uniref:Pectate lyase superfamily protein domain-containing protein n=1 Tax=Mangrovicoccus algicola TaxID=2771008 RepID=A0A8J7CJ72_9RHOB|nr:hypothetical protein [Mangrovicoccus algicola]MBE3637366.1 hypothetical protein [Mangrovicoccus algicola]